MGVSQSCKYFVNIKMAAEDLGAVQESLLQEITCNICHELMKDPRTLPCTHVYCRECLESLAKHSQAMGQGRSQCPECRQVVQMPNGDPVDLPKDFRTVRLKEVYEKMLQISQSPSSPATPAPEGSAESATLKCQLHGRAIEMYCISCRDILCQECVQVHKNHNYDYLSIEKNSIRRNINVQDPLVGHKNVLESDSHQPLSNFTASKDQASIRREKESRGCMRTGENDEQNMEQYEIQQKRRETMATEVKEYKSKVTAAIVEVLHTKAEVESQAKTRLSQVDAAFEGMLSLVHGKWQHLRSEIADEQREKTNTLSRQKDQLTQLFGETENLLTACSSRELQDSDSIQQWLESLQQTIETTSLQPAVTADVATSLTKGDLMKTCCNRCVLRYHIPDTSRCKLSGSLLTMPETDIQCSAHLEVRDSRGNVCPGFHNIEAELVCRRDNSKMIGALANTSKGAYSVLFVTPNRGRHMLNITLDNIRHPECPITLFVVKRPETLQSPVHTIRNPNGPTGLCFYDNQLIVSEESSYTVSVYNVNGTRALTIETGGEVAVDRETRSYYIANAITYQLHKFDADGICWKQVGTEGSEPGQLINPRGMEYYNGELYVVDSGNHRFQVFDKDLNLVRYFGREGVSNGCFESPTDVAIDDSGKLYITDTLNNRIQVTDLNGKFISNIKKNDKQRQYPHNPQKIKIFKGYIYTTEYHMNSVCVFTLTGNFVTTFGEGHIIRPEGIAINNDGYVYVSSNKESIVVF